VSPCGTDPIGGFYFDQNMSAPICGPFDGGQAAVFTAAAPDKPTANEDSAAVIAFDGSSGVLLVADGMGGGPEGERASAAALRAVAAAMDEQSRQDAGMLRTAIISGFEQANHAVMAVNSGAATTLTVVEIRGGVIRPYHVGDSMMLVCSNRGRVKMQTLSHAPVAFAVEAGVLDEADAMHHEDRHVVNNIIGTADMRIEIGSPLKLAARDTVLVASDGLFDNLHVEEIVEHIRKGPLDAAAASLAAEARRRMASPHPDLPHKPDDLTFVCYRLAR
jgi:serine/threonine protein phosphatase PrpC